LVAKVEIGLAEMKGGMNHLPSTSAMIVTLLGGQVVAVAAILATLEIASVH